MIDFKAVETPTSKNYLSPGHYKLRITGAKYIQPEGNNAAGNPKTPYIEVNFEGSMGMVDEKFYVSTGSFPRLKYLHEMWFGKEFDKSFKTIDEVGQYFEKVLTMKKEIEHGVVVAATEGNNGRLYSNLAPFNFILPKDMNFEEGAFEEGTLNYVNNVKRNTNNPSQKSNDTMLPGNNTTTANDDFNDLPFDI